jgi:hypothetical protein
VNAYRCTGRDALGLGDRCRAHVSIKPTDAAVWRALVDAFTDRTVLRAALSRWEKDLTSESGGADTLRERLSRIKAREESALTAMLDAELAGGREAIKKRYRTIMDERKKIEMDLARAEAQSRRHANGATWIEETVGLLRRYLTTVTDSLERQQIVRRLVERAEWNGAEVKLSCFISPESCTTCSRIAQFPLGSPQSETLRFVVVAKVAA